MGTAAIAASTDNANIITTDAESIDVSVGGKVLTKDKDYVLTYRDNVKVGTATVIVTFIGDYTGTMEQTFKITRKHSGGGGGSGSISTPKPTTDPNLTKPTVTDSNGNSLTDNTDVNSDNITITVPDNVKPPITVILPENKTLTDDNQYTITVINKDKKPQAGIDVIVRDKNGKEATGTTDENGVLIVPEIITVHTPYITGYENGSFLPDAHITRAETASMLSRVMSFNNITENKEFSDIIPGLWYCNAIKLMTDAGIINGYTDGTFRPDNNITRAEFITMLINNTEVTAYKGLPFNDVSSDIWSADYIYSAYTYGYISGYEDGSFRPDSPITRAEAVKIINCVLKRSDFGNGINPFTDLANTHWAYKDILEAAVEHTINAAIK